MHLFGSAAGRDYGAQRGGVYLNTDELTQEFIVLSTLILAIQRDSDSGIKLVAAITRAALPRIQADLQRVRQQMFRARLEVKKIEGRTKYTATVKGREPEVTTVVYTQEELRRLCEERALSYINQDGTN